MLDCKNDCYWDRVKSDSLVHCICNNRASVRCQERFISTIELYTYSLLTADPSRSPHTGSPLVSVFTPLALTMPPA